MTGQVREFLGSMRCGARALRGGVALVAAIACGCGGNGSGVSNGAPVITSATVSPTVLDAGGGVVTVRAEVAPSSAVSWVRATVTQPDGGQILLQMTATAPGIYEAAFTAAASSMGEQTYRVSVSAGNQAGQVSSTVEAGTVRVTASDGGPPPPPPL